jgi:hypothetical protein
MNEINRWQVALDQANELLDTSWFLDAEPGWIHEYGNAYNRKEIPLDVWYLRLAMTIGRGSIGRSWSLHSQRVT